MTGGRRDLFGIPVNVLSVVCATFFVLKAAFAGIPKDILRLTSFIARGAAYAPGNVGLGQ